MIHFIYFQFRNISCNRTSDKQLCTVKIGSASFFLSISRWLTSILYLYWQTSSKLIWSMLPGYEDLAWGFKPIRFTKKYFWINNNEYYLFKFNPRYIHWISRPGFSVSNSHLLLGKKIDLVYLWKRFAPHCNYIDKWHQHWQQFQFSNTQNFLSTPSNR